MRSATGRWRGRSRSVVCGFVCALLTACGRDHHVTVGSKNFTEQLILGEIAAQQIERKLNVRVERKLDLGGTLLTHGALVAGQIDLYPEYTGTAITNILKETPANDAAASYLRVKQAYLNRFHLVWLPPLGFNDTFAMVVRAKDGRALRNLSLSAAAGRPWRLGVGYEFLTRPDGLTALDRVYGFHWQGTPKSMDLGLLYQALRENQVDMAAGNSTDAALTDQRLTGLSDDKKAFPAYDACFVVREALLRDRVEVRGALTMLSGRINEEAMRNLNREVDVKHRPLAEVAKEFLATQP